MFAALFALLALAPFSARAAALMPGTTSTFTSPNGLEEACVQVARIPGGQYKAGDGKSEAALCSVNLYDPTVGACPKTWSTSPGMIAYKTGGLSQREFEAHHCTGRGNKAAQVAKFKSTMNEQDTSGTFSQASLLYYHFSRYFHALVSVPPAVYRSFDSDEYFLRVSAVAGGLGAMVRAGWDHMREFAQNPRALRNPQELFTPDLQQIYGIFVDEVGSTRYGPEVNGIRSGGLVDQAREFQRTPGFTALRSPKPFAQAVQDGVRAAPVAGETPSALQVGVWMRELSEIAVLDHILSQQDRVGNVDYSWYWVYTDNGQVKTQKEKRPPFKKLPRSRMARITPPSELAAFHPTLIQKTAINDNDAGVRPGYSNLARLTGMVAALRHFDAGVYQRLQALDADFQSQGPLYQYLNNTFYLSPRAVAQVVANTHEVAGILRKSCSRGLLRFDLDFENIAKGQVQEAAVDCRTP